PGGDPRGAVDGVRGAAGEVVGAGRAAAAAGLRAGAVRAGGPPAAAVVRPAQAAPPFDRLAPRVLLPDVVAERAGGVPHRGAGPVGDDVGDLGGVGAPVALVDELDDLLAPGGLDVQVDVGRPRPSG